MDELVALCLDAAQSGGASYADVRFVEGVSQSLGVRGASVEGVEAGESLGVGVRVLCDGAWGYAASGAPDRDEAERIARLAVEVARASAGTVSTAVELVPEPVHDDEWATPIEIDPFGVSLEDKISLLTAATAEMGSVAGIRSARGTMDFAREQVEFASTDGTHLRQTFVRSGGGIEAVAVADNEVQQRSYPGSFRGHFGGAGYELIVGMDLAGHALQTGEEAAALLSASECPSGVTDLVLDGHQMELQVHETAGHATELDRVLGMEASFAGTSFLNLRDTGSLRFGSPIVNIVADATTGGGLGTFGYDDEGVQAQKTYLVRDGILQGWQTSRETAARAGADRSTGSMRAEGWEHFPLIRMTNINLLPGEGTTEDLIAGVDDGIYMATNRSWSIDDKRKNFQFGCEIAWEIKRGRLTRMLRNPRYTGITPVFWASCDAIAGPEEWSMQGTPNCGKGQPGQTMHVGHGTAPARFRNALVGVGR